MSNKQFAERLGKELDSLGIPERLEDRIDAFSKLLKIPKFKAEAFLAGIIMPEPKVLTLLATELEVNPEWLVGKSLEKHLRERRTD